MLHICPYCDKTLSTKFNLQRHVDRDCSVIQVSKTMNDLRVGRSEERGEVALRKKSKSRERGVIDECVDDFDAQTADRVFDRIFASGTITSRDSLTTKFQWFKHYYWTSFQENVSSICKKKRSSKNVKEGFK